MCSKEAQKCYCEAANCRGWIGGDPDKEDKEEDRSRKGTKSVEKKDKKSKPKPKFSIVQELLEDQDVSHYITFCVSANYNLCFLVGERSHQTLPDGLEEQNAHPKLEQTDGSSGEAGQEEADAQPAATCRLSVQTTFLGLPRPPAGMELDGGS